MSESKLQLSEVDTVIADYLKRIDRGESIDRERFARAHRQLAGALTEFFDDLDHIGTLIERETSVNSTSDLTATVGDARSVDGHVRIDTQHWVPLTSGAPISFGDYDLLEELGRGGMGIVYKARQRSLDRIVCVKMMLMAELAEMNEFKRFRAEAMAIARLNHSGIVAIYEVGQHNGTPYYTMEFVEGSPLSKYVPEKRLAANQAADYVAQIAEAIHVAHQSGIIHRDLKPSNVLVDNGHRTHIMDFGVAKHLEMSEDLTVTGQVLGTPSYMSPEQAEARHGEVGRAADIYALGAILYALLTGRPPHCGEGAVETVRQVISETPVSPRWLNRTIPSDLETVCLKCLEKTPTARYATAAAVADDLRRFLAGEPIRARPVGRIGRFVRWMRRHPTAALLAASILLLVLVAAAGLAIHNAELALWNRRLSAALLLQGEALEQSERSELTARNLQYVSDMQLVETFAVEGDYRGSVDLLRRNIPPPGKPDPRGFEWFVLQQRRWRTGSTIASVASPLYFATFSPDGQLLAIGGGDEQIRVFDARTFEPRTTLLSGQVEINGVAFSKDGRRLASAGDDGSVKIWDLESGSTLLAIAAHQGHAFNVVFLRDDSTLLTCGGDAELRLWDAESGESVGTLPGHREAVDAFAVSSDQRHVWSVGADLLTIRSDLQTGQPLEPQIRHLQRPTCVAISSDGALSVSGDLDRRLCLCNWETGRIDYLETSHPVQSIALSADGRLLAAGHRNGSIRVWSVRPSSDASCGFRFDPVMGWNGHDGRVYGVAFENDGRHLISVGSDGKAKSWSVESILVREKSHSWEAIASDHEHGIAFLPGSALLATVNPQVGVELWDCSTPSTAPLRAYLLDEALTVGCSADGKLLAAGTADGRVVVWDMETGQVRHRIQTGHDVSQLEFSPAGRSLAVVTWQEGSAFRQTQLYRLPAETALFSQPMRNWRHVAFSRDGKLLYVALDEDDNIIAWNIESGSVAETFNQHDTTILEMGVSSNGSYVVSASKDRNMIIHDTTTHTDAVLGVGLRGDIVSFAFGPRGASVIVMDSLGVVRVCNLRAAQRVIDLLRIFSPGKPSGMALSSDGRYLAVHWGSELRVFDLLPEVARGK